MSSTWIEQIIVVFELKKNKRFCIIETLFSMLVIRKRLWPITIRFAFNLRNILQKEKHQNIWYDYRSFKSGSAVKEEFRHGKKFGNICVPRTQRKWDIHTYVTFIKPYIHRVTIVTIWSKNFKRFSFIHQKAIF